MGLAPYGQDILHEFFDDLIMEDDKEFFKLNPKYLNIPKGILYIDRAFNERAKAIIGSSRNKNQPLEQRHMDIAASLQAALERTILKIVERYLKETKKKMFVLLVGLLLIVS